MKIIDEILSPHIRMVHGVFPMIDEANCYPAMTEYAQSLAKEVVGELEAKITHDPKHMGYENGLHNAINLIKAKFDLI